MCTGGLLRAGPCTEEVRRGTKCYKQTKKNTYLKRELVEVDVHLPLTKKQACDGERGDAEGRRARAGAGGG